MSACFNKIYLASRSPRRDELLRQIGVDFDILPSDIDEEIIADETVEHYVLRLARIKAEACLQQITCDILPVLPVLAADTSVCVDGKILGKPQNNEEACAMLNALSDCWHTVVTGLALLFNDKVEIMLSSTQVKMAPLSKTEIATYIASGEPYDKAGAYGIQGRAGVFIQRIEGSYSGVMGLPLYETSQLLRKAGIFLP